MVSKRIYVGLASIALGGVLFIWGANNLVSKVGIWGEALKDKRINRYDYIQPQVVREESFENGKKEIKYITNNSIMAIVGASLGVFGVILAGPKLNLLSSWWYDKGTDYGKSLSTYKRHSYQEKAERRRWEIG